jgi:hypothetical protein
MSFASPMWLGLILPWLALAVWLLWMRYSGTRVPFLDLWRGPIEPARATRRLRVPPLALPALLMAMLLAILAAARPILLPPVRPALPPQPVSATRPSSNVAIVRLAAIEHPRPQVMVTVRNESELTSATLQLHSGGPSTQTSVVLGPRGTERNVFVDLPRFGDEIEAVLRSEGDEFAADNRATLRRQPAWPRVELRGDVPPAVRRVAEAYSRARPAPQNSPVVAIPPAGSERGVLIGDVDGQPTSSGNVAAVAHRICDNVDLRSIGPMRLGSGKPPGNDWAPILTLGGTPIVQVRESPVRQVWIGFDSVDFARTPAFVVFWTNVLDWVANSPSEVFVASDLPATRPAASEAAKPQAASEPAPPPRGLELAPWVAFSALICLFCAVLVWPAPARPRHA